MKYEMKLITNQEYNNLQKTSFIQLAKDTFEIDFNSWVKKGCWNDNYQCFSYSVDNQVVANVSLNFMEVFENGVTYKAIEIGTVMVSPQFRKRGLAKELMKHALQQYKDKVDIIFLFANQDVLEFYPKLGFQRAYNQNLVWHNNQKLTSPNFLSKLEKINLEDLDRWDWVQNRIKSAVYLKQPLNFNPDITLISFYLLNVYQEDIYFDRENDCIWIIKKTNDNEIVIVDVFLNHDNLMEWEKILSQFKTVEFGFNPNFSHKNIIAQKNLDDDNALFFYKGLDLIKSELIIRTLAIG